MSWPWGLTPLVIHPTDYLGPGFLKPDRSNPGCASRPLCSGYGGLELGLGLVEPVEVIWHAETDPYPARVHQAHWPSAPNIGDIQEAAWQELEPPDVLTAGYPCQPFSYAGNRQGAKDERHLWPSVAQAIRILRPRRILLENVAGHLTMGFSDVAKDLAQMGYDIRWGCVRASDTGAPHKRERLFIYAASGDPNSSRFEGAQQDQDRTGQPDSDAATQPQDYRQSGGWGSWGWGPGPEDRGNAPTDPYSGSQPEQDSKPLEPQQSAQPRDDAGRLGLDEDSWGPYWPAIQRWEAITRPAPHPTDPLGRLSPVFVEWVMGLPEGWVTSLEISKTAKLKMLGNGVVPQAAALAWQLLNPQTNQEEHNGNGRR